MNTQSLIKFIITLESLLKFPRDRLFFLTITLPAYETGFQALGKAINKLTTFFGKQNIEWVKVFETHLSGQIHIHCVLLLPWNTRKEVFNRSGIDGKAPQSVIEQHYSERLLQLSRTLGKRMEAYGFGRWNMSPVCDMQALISYLTKEAGTSLGHHVRRWSCSKGLRVCKGPIALCSPRARARRQATHFAAYGLGCRTIEELRSLLGKHWSFILMNLINRFTDGILHKQTRAIVNHIRWRIDDNYYRHGAHSPLECNT
ncbi:hypothetical protein H5P28_18620 [Ruficoccus amylovorans]|uniref:Replication protein n=1 Tax=Ruficoccus amylovorans TaxID=1804625 RepID=A0A842HL86_9BACT|nr:hypothetical protein [Ruficoccus amylovorans]MBC2596286.1 hypothetical protein [Ruficoccus amylovorans]